MKYPNHLKKLWSWITCVDNLPISALNAAASANIELKNSIYGTLLIMIMYESGLLHIYDRRRIPATLTHWEFESRVWILISALNALAPENIDLKSNIHCALCLGWFKQRRSVFDNFPETLNCHRNLSLEVMKTCVNNFTKLNSISNSWDFEIIL